MAAPPLENWLCESFTNLLHMRLVEQCLSLLDGTKPYTVDDLAADVVKTEGIRLIAESLANIFDVTTNQVQRVLEWEAKQVILTH